MGYENTVTGALNRSSIVRGDVGFVAGTWAGSAGTAKIETGGSTVLGGGYGVHIDSMLPEGTSMITTAPNQDGEGLTENGSIKVVVRSSAAGTGASSVEGTWWAFVTV